MSWFELKGLRHTLPYTYIQHTHQVIKYVSLVNMDGDEGLILGPLHSLQISCGHVNECVEQIKEELVGFGHDAPIISSIGERLFRVPCPYHLNSKQANLDQGQGNLVMTLLRDGQMY